MVFEEREFIPVVFGGDINTYSVARAFYEAYGVRTWCFGKYRTGPSYQSRIVCYHADEKIDTDEVFLQTINGFANSHPDKKILAIGCGDSYAALLSRHKNDLAGNVIAPYIDYSLMSELQLKERFYELCEKHGVPYPGTIIYRQEMGMDFEMPFSYPVILKPSDSIRYWEHPFETQNKVYTISSREEMLSVIGDIYGAGYPGTLIIQDMIPGNDEYMRVLTSYSDRAGKVKMMCLGHVLLEEHTPHGLGNHAVIITESEKDLMKRAKALLEDIGYVGFSNFDIKYDSRDGQYKFFEINTRQGRSNYYVTGSGINIAQLVVEDYIYQKELAFRTPAREHLWMVVPSPVAFEHVKDPAMKAKLKKLIRQGRVVNPLFMKGDLGMPRLARMLKLYLRQYGLYRKYYK